MQYSFQDAISRDNITRACKEPVDHVEHRVLDML